MYRLELALKRGAKGREKSVRDDLAAYDLARMDTARVGLPAPDFTLTDVDGRRVRLSDYRGKKAVALVFIYGVNCMFCGGQVGQLRHRLAEFEKIGAAVLVVESREPYRVRETLGDARTSSDERMPILCDPSHVASATYGVALQMNHAEWINRPSTFLIDRDGILRIERRSKEIRVRYPVGDMLAEFEKMQAK
jgi:peroxiredoxin